MAAVLNAVLGIFGLVRVPWCIGHWRVVDGKLHRKSIQIGWRIIRRSDKLEDGATALDYFAARHGLAALSNHKE